MRTMPQFKDETVLHEYKITITDYFTLSLSHQSPGYIVSLAFKEIALSKMSPSNSSDKVLVLHFLNFHTSS